MRLSFAFLLCYFIRAQKKIIQIFHCVLDNLCRKNLYQNAIISQNIEKKTVYLILYSHWIGESNLDAELDHRRVRSIAKQILCQFLHIVDSMPFYFVVIFIFSLFKFIINAYHSIWIDKKKFKLKLFCRRQQKLKIIMEKEISEAYIWQSTA